MSVTGKKIASVLFIFCFIALAGDLSAQGTRKGVTVGIETIAGPVMSGELISVQSDSLLILDAETNADLSVNIDEIKTIHVNNKSRMLEVGVLGALIGAAGQGLIDKTEKTVQHGVGGDDDEKITQKHTSFLLGAAVVGGAGVLIGMALGIDKTIQIQGQSDAEIQEALKKLAKKSRIRVMQ